MSSSNWRVVLDTGEVCTIVSGYEFTYDRKNWHTATFGMITSGSYDGDYAAVVDLAKMHKWTVREFVPPGEPTRAEAVDAAVRSAVAKLVVTVTDRLDARSRECRGYASEHVQEKARAYDHAAEILRAEAMLRAAGAP